MNIRDFNVLLDHSSENVRNDVDQEGKEGLDMNNLVSILKQFEPTMNDEEMKEIIESLDLNRNVIVGFEAFLNIFGKGDTETDSL